MSQFFDESKWDELLAKPDGYMQVVPEYQKLFETISQDDKEQLKAEFYGYFENRLDRQVIALADKPYGLDDERKSVDTAIIHHTSRLPGLTWQAIDAIHFTRLYAPYFVNPTQANEEFLKAKPIGSDHWRDDRMVFYAYHWLVRADGSAERLLNDNEIGWHAGDWDVNCRSVGIAIDDDLTDKAPTATMLDGVAKVIKHYSAITPERVLGHLEVNPDSISPGHKFLADWKPQLLERLKDN